MVKMNGTKKIFCIGSNIESYNCLKYLISNNCEIDTLITLPSGSGKEISDYADLHGLCYENHIKTIDTTNVNEDKTILRIKKDDPDYLFTLGWSQIFTKDLIDSFSYGVIGTHPSKLPYGRGRAPVPWTILEGLKKTAVSFFKIDSGIDTGEIILQKEVLLPDRPYAMQLYKMVSDALGEGFMEIYSIIIADNKLPSRVQSKDASLHRGKRTMTDGLIEFNKPVEEIDRLVRAVSNPYPGAYCYYKDMKIIFWEVDLDEYQDYKGTIGQILKKKGAAILVQVSDGAIWLGKPTNESGEGIASSFFKVGEKLGYNLQDQIYYLRKKLC